MSKTQKRNAEQFENWEDAKYKDDPDSIPKKFKRAPKRYQTGFLAKLDGRFITYKELKSSFDEVTGDLGGAEGLSHVQVCLVERFVFLEFVLRQIEQRIATEPKKSAKLISRWVQALNSLIGLGRVVGLERRARKVASLQAYVKGKDAR